MSEPIVNKFIALEKGLVARLSHLNKDSFRTKYGGEKSVEYIYNPLDYAFDLHKQYLEKYCQSYKKVIFLGMNPGPFGMVQTGVPFGEIAAVRNYLKIDGKVSKPASVHPKRPVDGLDCKRSEVSGKRLWGLFKELSNDDPDVFFKYCFVHNYCPLALISKSGLNITPADLKEDDQKTLNSICNENLVEVFKLLKVEIVVGIGKFAEKRAQEVIKKYELNIKIVGIPHPSPRSKGSGNWAITTESLLKEYDLLDYIQ